MFLEFFNGVLGHYTFESDKVNVLIDGLHSFAYPLGQLTFLVGSLSTVVGDEKLTSREDLIGLLFFYVQSDEDTFLKVDEVSKAEAQPFDVFNQLVGSFQFCV